ncbi:MAG TPA: hypothetical protein VNZ64_27910 [Candidatus Acidoferrum sp.]|jgi:hypothetical protein|nr:hypothetical protein [Candidatus Acidoferrum sp.]
MATFRTELEQHFEELIAHRRWFDFQKFAFHLAKQKWPSLQATEPIHDLGSDGLLVVNGELKLALACSLDGDLTKLRKDCRRIKETRQTVDKVIFATTRRITEQTAEEWRKKIREEFLLHLEQVLGREWLISEAEEGRMRWLCRDYLGMAVPDPDGPDEDLPRLRTAANKILAVWQQKYAAHGLPTVDLVLGLVSKDRGQTRRVSDIQKEIEAGCRLWVEGAPGAGKTHSLTTLAGMLLSRGDGQLLPILVSLRALSQRGGSLLGYVAAQPAVQEQGITETRLAKLAGIGRTVFFFNGWNEIGADRWLATIETINDFAEQMPAAGIVIVSRPVGDSGAGFSCRRLQLLPLSGSDIQTVLERAGIPSWRSAWSKLNEAEGILELASVPLFLHELVRELQANSELPLTRLEILHRMVLRAERDHQAVLQESCLRGNAERYLRGLAWDMTFTGRVDLSFSNAARSVAQTIRSLENESLIVRSPDPPDILQELVRTHLLERDADVVVFVHQLVQEYFAALELADRLRLNRLLLDRASPILRSYEWEQTLTLAFEKLVEQGHNGTAARIVRNLGIIDLEGACRLVGIRPEVWSLVEAQLQADIRRLVQSKDRNALWIATRCAACTGQAVFSMMVAPVLLDGGPPHRSCLDDVPAAAVLSAAGNDFAIRVLAIADDRRRIKVLDYLHRSNSFATENLSATLAENDPSPSVRRSAFFYLFKRGRSGFFRLFLRDVKSLGWNFHMLRVLQASTYASSHRIGKVSKALLQEESDPEERTRIIRQWSELRGEGWDKAAKEEYACLTDRAVSTPSDSEKVTQCRFVLLDRLSRIDPKWCSRRFADEIFRTQDMQRMSILSPEAISEQEDRRWLIDQQVKKIVATCSDRPGFEKVFHLDPEYSARALITYFLKNPVPREYGLDFPPPPTA